MAAPRVRRGPARREELRREGEERNVAYQGLSLKEKIALQVAGGHRGRQLEKLRKEQGT